MELRLTDFASPFLTSAARAEQVCAEVFAHWDAEAVTLDFANVRPMTPSFANTLVMNLLHRVSLDEMKARVRFENTSPHIDAVLDRAITRHLKLGIELTAYISA
jgi:hypothetical protein